MAKKTKTPAPPPPSPPLPEEPSAEWQAWYEEKVEYMPSTRTATDGRQTDGRQTDNRLPRKKPYRDAYEKSKLRFLMRYKLPAIQEALVSDRALEMENQLDQGNVLTSQQQPHGHVTLFSVSNHHQPEVMHDQNKNVVTSHEKVRHVEEDGVIITTTNVANGDTLPMRLDKDSKTNQYGVVSRDSSDEAPDVVIVDQKVSTGSETNGDSVPRETATQTKKKKSRRRSRKCLIMIYVLVFLGVASSAIAVYFAVNAIKDGSI